MKKVTSKTSFTALFAFVLALCATGLTGCGTMAGRTKSSMGVQAASEKVGVSFEVVNAAGAVVASGATPAVVVLPSGKNYTIKFKDANDADAEQAVKKTLNFQVLNQDLRALYLAFPGIISLIVDPITGALFKMPDVVTLEGAAYHPQAAPKEAAAAKFFIASIDDVRPEARQYLIPVEHGELAY
jgi:predicted small secreted protein